MSSGGLSKTRLGRMHDVMAGHVERGDVPGVVTLVSRGGEVHVGAIGTKTLAGDDPMQSDTIFRIDSLTKPITAAAAMVLVEECKLRLDEPVDPWLPELADRQVLRAIDSPLDDTVPANRPITLRDLLTFRMGFGIIMEPSSTYPIQKSVGELEIMGMGPPKPQTPHDPDEWIRRLGTLPLMHQPGEKWMYNMSFYVLGVLISRVAGQDLPTFLRERIFDPLGMEDTGFHVPAEKLDRLPSCYQVNPETGALDLHDGVDDSQWSRPPAFPNAGAALVSTVNDYLAFGRMMLGKGKHGSKRVLSRPSVELMTTDQLTREQKTGASVFLGDNRGWGLGVSMIASRGDVAAVPGQFGWDGGYGTSWYSDPSEDMVGILMTQCLGFPFGIYLDFWTSAYAALDD